MSTEKRVLVPRTVTVTTELKFFGLESGVSSGSNIGIAFDIPEGMSERDIKAAIFREKEELDVMAATMELAKSSVARERYEKWKGRLRTVYDKLLGRSSPEDKAG